MNNKLYCTFIEEDEVNEVIDEIVGEYKVLFNKIFILSSIDEDKLMLTYNIDVPYGNYNLHLPNTILVHRKKQTNTLYTINALNEVIKYLNNGILDTSYQVPWENFKNMIMVTNSEGLNKINTRIFKIVNI